MQDYSSREFEGWGKLVLGSRNGLEVTEVKKAKSMPKASCNAESRTRSKRMIFFEIPWCVVRWDVVMAMRLRGLCRIPVVWIVSPYREVDARFVRNVGGPPNTASLPWQRS